MRSKHNSSTANTGSLIDTNPFTHMVNGTKRVVSENLRSLILVSLTTFVSLGLIFGLFLIAVGLDLRNVNNYLRPEESLGGLSTLPTMLVFLTIAALVSAFFEIAIVRVILNGVRGYPTSVTESFKFAAKRWPTLILSGLIVLLAISAVGLSVGGIVAAAGSSVMLMVAPLAVVIAVVAIWRLFFFVFLMVFVEENNPGPIGAIKKSNDLGRKAPLAIVLLLLALLFVFLALDMISSQRSQPLAAAGIILSILFNYVAIAAAANLYDQVVSEPR